MGTIRVRPAEYVPNPIELCAYSRRITGCWSFVPGLSARSAVTGPSRGVDSPQWTADWREGTAAPAQAGAGMCGGVMVRGPGAGDGERFPNYAHVVTLSGAAGFGHGVPGDLAWLPAPPQISPPATVKPGSDPVARSELMNELPAFSQAYAAGDNTALSRFGRWGVSLTGLGGAASSGSITSLQVPPGRATRRYNGDGHMAGSRPGRGRYHKIRDGIPHVGRRPAKRQMVCK